DVALLARNTPDANATYEFGYAQKTRSPNLYERYSWSTGGMAMVMNNFVGDGNGYIGNPNLKPEVAHTLSVTGDWHSADRSYELKATPYYTHVTDFIDAQRCPVGLGCYTAANSAKTTGFVYLQYVNQSARLYGIDISGHMPLGKTAWGDWGLKGLLNYTKGKNRDTDDNLYNIMPLNAKLTLTHQLGGWDDALEVVGVQDKSHLSSVRDEVRTPGYGLVNLRASYSWTKTRLDFGIENVFDKLYYLPLGGAYVGQGVTMGFSGAPWGIAVPGTGRSINTAVTFKF
ncbi:MAG TPA: TonB-dependent receptor, partial [Rhodocyclaceae bacterium]|nr:TonB-dependent receptor [Rhodocyclaceae bacterium]